ncbi:hypothetical protein lerEdw1_020015 [Lerista edwardsae]|nr:hypothetical protein lerEdw1_020015 [Lerista edwardsae]
MSSLFGQFMTSLCAPKGNVQNMVSGGWKFFSGSFYFFSREAKPWQAADASCQSHGAHLTSVTSREEKEYLIRETGGKQVWIGLTDQREEGKWIWADGTKYSQAVR